MTDERVHVLVKQPSKPYDEHVLVFEDLGMAEAAVSELGIDPMDLTPNGRLIEDVPLVRVGEEVDVHE